MANNFHGGENQPVQFAVTGGANALLNVTGHSLDIMRILFDVTNTSHGGDTARISGKRDASGTVNADFDADLPPYLNPPNIIEGVLGIMLFFYSPLVLGRPIQVPVIVEKIHYQSAVDAKTIYSFDVKMSKIAGALVYPAQ